MLLDNSAFVLGPAGVAAVEVVAANQEVGLVLGVVDALELVLNLEL